MIKSRKIVGLKQTKKPVLYFAKMSILIWKLKTVIFQQGIIHAHSSAGNPEKNREMTAQKE